MDGGGKQRDRMDLIKTKVKENATHRRERRVLRSMNEPFIVTSDERLSRISKARRRRGSNRQCI